MEKILVFGHKNPDTDTICSSMVKEILNKLSGKIDEETMINLNLQVFIIQ